MCALICSGWVRMSKPATVPAPPWARGCRRACGWWSTCRPRWARGSRRSRPLRTSKLTRLTATKPPNRFSRLSDHHGRVAVRFSFRILRDHKGHSHGCNTDVTRIIQYTNRLNSRLALPGNDRKRDEGKFELGKSSTTSCPLSSCLVRQNSSNGSIRRSPIRVSSVFHPWPNSEVSPASCASICPSTETNTSSSDGSMGGCPRALRRLRPAARGPAAVVPGASSVTTWTRSPNSPTDFRSSFSRSKCKPPGAPTCGFRGSCPASAA